MEHSCVFLAFFYISRLPAHFFMTDDNNRELQGMLPVGEAIIRAFVVGAALADKWLDDYALTARHW
jgi:hypothetical protein